MSLELRRFFGACSAEISPGHIKVAQICWMSRRGDGKAAWEAIKKSRQVLAAFEGEERVDF